MFDRRGFSLPLILIVCILMSIVLFPFIVSRITARQQNKITFQQVKAHYLAQAGIQHALLKLRILPNESYDASAAARGICPFVVSPTVPSVGTLQTCLLDDFREDIRASESPDIYRIPYSEFPGWSYSCVSLRAVNALTTPAAASTGTRSHTVEIQVQANVPYNFKGDLKICTDVVTRLVQVSRGR